ncbi:UNKNOWN [Stylonychia lemnae]|uniref:Uncharacterized protein n=1 Tax=Stylonychia lemnae TaxID=5949 RepID=A0A077ZW49_STYLE|nr:UNKNOWN [Stylonychia lemnae]|eukprot:CDW73495.1 UNKNOWN [Stylonychia lemnae]
MLLAEYYYDKDYQNRSIDIIEFDTLQTKNTINLSGIQCDSKIFHRIFNDVDYIFYQEGQFICMIALDDFIEQSPVCYQLKDHLIFHSRGKSIFVDTKSLDIAKQLDKYYYSFKYQDLYEYAMDQDFNIYEYENLEGFNLTKKLQLYHTNIKWMYAIETTLNRLIIFFGNEKIDYNLLIFDSLTFQLVGNIENYFNHLIKIDPIGNKIYFLDPNIRDQINYFNFSANLSECYEIIPVINNGQYLMIEEYQDMKKNYLFYNSKQVGKIMVKDLLTGVIKEISKEFYESCGDFPDQLDEIFINKNLKQTQEVKKDDYEIVTEINSEDILIENDGDFVYLNGNRKLNWADFRIKSGFEFQDESSFCIMFNQFHEKQYIYDQATWSKIVYFDKQSLKFESIDLIEETDLEIYPHQAILNENLGYLMRIIQK